jgi:hypothetical protein
VSDTRYANVLHLEHLLFVPTALLGIMLYLSYLVQMHVLAVVVLAVGAGLALGVDAVGLTMGACLRSFLQQQLVVSSWFWSFFFRWLWPFFFSWVWPSNWSSPAGSGRPSTYFYVAQLDLTRYSPWWVFLWPLFFWLSGLGLTALVVVCGSLGRYAQQDFLLKIAFFALCVLFGGQLHVALCVLLGGQLQHVH